MNGVDEERGGIRLHIFVPTKPRARRTAKLPSCSGSCPSVCYPPPLPPPRCRRPLLSRRLSLVVVSSPPRRRRCCESPPRVELSLRRVSPPPSAARREQDRSSGGGCPPKHAVGHLRRGEARREGTSAKENDETTKSISKLGVYFSYSN